MEGCSLTPMPCCFTFSEGSSVSRPLAVLCLSDAEMRARGDSGSPGVQAVRGALSVENLSTI